MNTSNIWRKLRNKKYRDAFVASQLKRGMPFQISAMRKKLDWSQGDLAKASGVTQGVISRAENPNYGNLTFNTVLRIAAGFDVAFVGWFVPFTKLTEWYENLSEESVQVATFEEENEQQKDRTDEKQPAVELNWHIFREVLSEGRGMQLADLIRCLRENITVMQPSIPAGTEPKIPQPRSRQALPHDVPTFGNPSASGSLKMPVEAHP